MTTTKQDLVTRLKHVQVLGEQTVQSGERNVHRICDDGIRAQFRAAGLSLLKDMYGEADHHYTDFEAHVRSSAPDGYERGVGFLQAVIDDVEHDWLMKTTSLIAGEVFSDFLEMGEHLVEQGYEIAGAVVAGASLESHLRRLCDDNGIVTQATNQKGVVKPLPAETLNQELARKPVYGKGELKDVTSWLDTRNEAAHGHKVIPEKVDLMIRGIRLFMSRFPA
jgi:hypothetical protein